MNWWTDHGTKILGAITALLSTVSTVAPMFGGKGLAIGAAATGILTGLGTMRRGFTNTTTLEQNRGNPQ